MRGKSCTVCLCVLAPRGCFFFFLACFSGRKHLSRNMSKKMSSPIYLCPFVVYPYYHQSRPLACWQFSAQVVCPGRHRVKAFNCCSLYTQVIAVLIWRALLKLLCPFRLTRGKRSNTSRLGGTRAFFLSLGILVRRRGTGPAIAMFYRVCCVYANNFIITNI